MELLILAELCKVQDKVTDKTLLPAVLSTETRKEIRTRLNMSEAAFNNNISRLKKKDLISDVSGVDDKLMLKGMTDIMFSFKLID
jgi:DNA-binding MarR family transcriptional regulator